MWKDGEYGMKCNDGKGGVHEKPCECSPIDKDRGMCYFIPNQEQSRKNLSSLLFRHDIENLEQFCDEKTHNREAPTHHNIRCGFQSAWEVIKTSIHMTDLNDLNSKNTLDKPPDPLFTITHEGVERVCLLLDTSSSMLWNDRIGRIRQAAMNYISVIPPKNFVSVVTFNKRAVIRSFLTNIQNEDSREWLSQRLPIDLDVSTGTSIVQGLEKCLELFNSTGPEKFRSGGGRILLLTDGSETDGPFLNSRVHNEVTERKVRVDTIAFGQEATTRLEELSQATSGSSYYASLPESGILASENTNPLEDAFNAHLQNLNLVQLISNQTDLFAGDDRNYTFIVDYTANTEVKLTFNYDPLSIATNKNYVPVVSVYGLDNELLCNSRTRK